MNFKRLATQVLMKNIDSANNSDNAGSALDSLVGGSKGFDLGEIVDKFENSGGDLAKIAKSWLGEGSNDSMTVSQVQQAIGSDKIAAFARKMGLSPDLAGEKLSKILPELIDRSSLDGSLINSPGRKGFLRGFASRFLQKTA